MNPRVRAVPLAGVLVAVLLAVGPWPVLSVTGTHAAVPMCGGSHWVGAWAAVPSGVGMEFGDQTLRLIVTPHLGGKQVRVRLTNRLGSQPVRFASAFIGLRRSGAQLVPGSNRRLTFGHAGSTTLPAGGQVVSDVVRLSYGAFQHLAVSLHVAGGTGPATAHGGAYQTSYFTRATSGDHAADDDGVAFDSTMTSWPFLAGVDVRGSNRVASVVAVGDSITDGTQGSDGTYLLGNPGIVDKNDRYPDFLARRLLGVAGGARFSVLNAGIGGNRVLQDAPFYSPDYGPSLLRRLDPDVIAQTGATDVIVMEGTNDLGYPPTASASQVIEGLRVVVRRLHAAGLNVVLGTQAPSEGLVLLGLHGLPPAISARDEINAWIRSASGADAVVDFNAALRDPAHPDRLNPAYDSSDHLHPNTAGYRAMANAIDLSRLRGARCSTAKKATRISLRVSPRRGTKPPYSFRVMGRLARAGGSACPTNARVTVRATQDRHALRSNRPRLSPTCRFRARIGVQAHRLVVGKRVSIVVSFAGTTKLKPTRARKSVRIK